MQVRVVKLANWDAPIHLERRSLEGRRAYGAEIARRWRERHPDRVKKINAEQYAKNREHILAKKKAQRNGPGREKFLERQRAANHRHYQKNKERITAARRARRKAASLRLAPSAHHPWRSR